MKIEVFEVYRSNSGVDEDPASTKVYAKIRLSMSDITNIATARIMLSYSSTSFGAADSENEYLGTITVEDLGVTKVLEFGTFSLNSSWYFVLTFEDGFSTEVSAKDILIRNDVPIFVARNRKGISFGMYSNAQLNKPMFESAFPAYLYGGIKDFGSDWFELTPMEGVVNGGEYGGGNLRARQIEGHFIIQGSVTVTPGSKTIPLAKLPDTDWWPDINQGSVFSINACKGARIARIAVHGPEDEYPGHLCLSWVRDLADGTLYTSAAIWVQCSIDYWIYDETTTIVDSNARLGEAILGEMILGGD